MIRLNTGVRTAIVILATFSPFVFPWQLTLFLGFCAGLIFPPLALFMGFLTDILYFAGNGWPMGTAIGLLGYGICTFVRYIVRTRIM